MLKIRIGVWLAIGILGKGYAQTPSRQAQKQLEQVLAWLPADTETILVANGPFFVPAFKDDSNVGPDQPLSTAEVAQKLVFSLPLSRFQLKDGVLQNFLKGTKIDFAIEGSRHFRAPSVLGEMPYEGCSVAILADPMAGRADSFVKKSAGTIARMEQIAGQRAAVFEEMLEDDSWTTFVVFPRPNVVVACTDAGYLREVLERMNGKSGQRCLSSALPEWKCVDTAAPLWGMRHYDRTQADLDPTSPFGGRKAGNLPDEMAIGVTFRTDAIKRMAVISYLSDTKTGLEPVRLVLSTNIGPGAADEVSVRYRTLDRGLEASYDFVQPGLPGYFLFVLVAMFGHGVYV